MDNQNRIAALLIALSGTQVQNVELFPQLIFDGKGDALFHEFDTHSNRHMEYVRDRGWFADPPIGELLRDFRST